MKKSRHTEEKVIAAVKQMEGGYLGDSAVEPATKSTTAAISTGLK